MKNFISLEILVNICLIFYAPHRLLSCIKLSSEYWKMDGIIPDF